MTNPPYCGDCKFFLLQPEPWRLPRCGRRTLLSMIDGSIDFPMASVQRQFELDGYCGPAGKYFEPKGMPHEPATR